MTISAFGAACLVLSGVDNCFMSSDWIVSAPQSPEEFEAYFELRWQVLRAFHDLPRGSERDEFDEPGVEADHVAVSNGQGELLGVGRLHLNSPDQAQIRYMAVRDGNRSRGVGRALVSRLEELAKRRSVKRVVLNAREAVVGFYQRCGYQVVADGPTMFEEVKHKRMEKVL